MRATAYACVAILLVVAAPNRSAADSFYLPIYVVGQWNGVWWHWCQVCPGGTDYVYTSDVRIHTVGQDCDHPLDKIYTPLLLARAKDELTKKMEPNKETVARLKRETESLTEQIKALEASKKDPEALKKARDDFARKDLELRSYLAPILQLDNAKTHEDPKSYKFAPDLRAVQSRHVSQRKDKDGQSEELEDNFVIVSPEFTIADDRMVRVSSSHLPAPGYRYFRLIALQPSAKVKAGSVTTDLLRIGQEVDPNDMKEFDDDHTVSYKDKYGDRQIVILAKDKDRNFKEWHVSTMYRFKN